MPMVQQILTQMGQLNTVNTQTVQTLCNGLNVQPQQVVQIAGMVLPCLTTGTPLYNTVNSICGLNFPTANTLPAVIAAPIQQQQQTILTQVPQNIQQTIVQQVNVPMPMVQQILTQMGQLNTVNTQTVQTLCNGLNVQPQQVVQIAGMVRPCLTTGTPLYKTFNSICSLRFPVANSIVTAPIIQQQVNIRPQQNVVPPTIAAPQIISHQQVIQQQQVIQPTFVLMPQVVQVLPAMVITLGIPATAGTGCMQAVLRRCQSVRGYSRAASQNDTQMTAVEVIKAIAAMKSTTPEAAVTQLAAAQDVPTSFVMAVAGGVMETYEGLGQASAPGYDMFKAISALAAPVADANLTTVAVATPSLSALNANASTVNVVSAGVAVQMFVAVASFFTYYL
ncbi:hypothetical protein BC830DRAFT_1153859 [Chytriomyces sp. MP71]|nr:hypothetical protein BC830DRAFT_1153859 [Chytriomyces sp. MP71]